MTPARYKELFHSEMASLLKALKRRKGLKKEVDDLNKEIAKKREGILGLAALAEIDVRKTYPEVFVADVQAQLGLTDAIRKIFHEWDQGEGYSPTEIREGLIDIGFPIHQHKNPLASIVAVLKRLVDAGFLMPATDNETNKTIYYWADGFGATQIKNRDDDEVGIEPDTEA